jgi:hypothetical protein
MTITLDQLFGAGATQDATTLTLSKADFVGVGLNGAADNSAQSLFVAIFLKAAQVLTEANQALDSTQLVTLGRDLDSLITRDGNTYTRVGYSSNFDKLTPTTVIDPDDF